MEVIRKPTPNLWVGRNGKPIKGIVCHSTAGTTNGTIAWFANPNADASAHYLIAEDGKVYQFCSELDSAWHAGIVDDGHMPSWCDENLNRFTIGIELTDNLDENWQYPQPQRDSFIQLVNELCTRFDIPKDKEHILLHKDLCPSRRHDPVGAFSLDWVLNMPDDAIDQLNSCRADLQSYGQSLERNAEEIKSLRADADVLRSRISDLTEEKTALDKTINTLSIEIGQTRKEKDELITALQASEEEVNDLKKTVDKLEKQATKDFTWSEIGHLIIKKLGGDRNGST